MQPVFCGRRVRGALIAAMLTLAGAVFYGVTASPASAATTTTITVDRNSGGRVYDGIGAISGGGGNSRLLYDYPAAQQAQILDYLFKPNYGANLQLLKLEIGGDANSTDGAEPSHEHVRGDINCGVGYEFWLGRQAVARNPNVKLYGLPWTAPGWIGGGNFWSQDMIDYDISWLNCAKQNGLTISYLGGWNERGYNVSWYEQLRSSLNANGFSGVQIVGDDSGWGVATDIANNPTFANAVSVIGVHYPCEGGDGGNANSCPRNTTATNTGKPMWASENGSIDMNAGAPALIRSFTRGYVDASMTAYINWPLLAAIYPNLPYSTVGLMTASQPWSGNYSVGESTWATAQVSQFAQPGWKFVDSGSGYLGGAESNGSYVTIKSTNNTDYSTIIESTTATGAQTVNVNVRNGLSVGTVHVWTTAVNSPNPGTAMIHSQDIAPSNGSYSLTVQPGYIYTLTTTTGQGKGTATSPAPAALPLPYSDNFDGYANRAMAKYFSTMQGAYEVRACAAGRSGQCLQQVAPVRPINWQDDSDAFGLLGDTSWSNYTVSTDVDMQQSGTVTLLGRANTQTRPQRQQAAYQLRISDSGAWAIAKNSSSGNLTTLASGSHPALGLNTWHTIKLGFSGDQITAIVDGATLGTAHDSSYPAGQAGLGVVGYQTDQFDNLTVTPNAAGSFGGILKGQESGLCVDVPGNTQTNGTPVDLWDCNGGTNQSWTLTPSGQLMVYGTKCLDVNGGSSTDGALVQIYDCNGTGGQRWTVSADGSVVNAGSGKCLDATNHGTTNGSGLEIWTCNGGPNQEWARGSVTGILRGQQSGRCVDVPGGNQTNGTQPALWDCNNGNNQAWTSTTTNQLTVFDSKCLNVTGGGAADGTAVQIWDCNGTGAQQWRVRSDGSVVNVPSGKCLDASGQGTTNGTLLVIWPCDGASNQIWSRS
jgi:hypothetical protein